MAVAASAALAASPATLVAALTAELARFLRAPNPKGILRVEAGRRRLSSVPSLPEVCVYSVARIVATEILLSHGDSGDFMCLRGNSRDFFFMSMRCFVILESKPLQQERSFFFSRDSLRHCLRRRRRHRCPPRPRLPRSRRQSNHSTDDGEKGGAKSSAEGTRAAAEYLKPPPSSTRTFFNFPSFNVLPKWSSRAADKHNTTSFTH